MSKWLVGNATARIYIIFAMHSAITVFVFFGVNSVHWLERKFAFGWKFQWIYTLKLFLPLASFYHATRALVGRYSSLFLTVKRSTIWFLCGFFATHTRFASNSHEIPAKKTNAISAVDSPMRSMNLLHFCRRWILFQVPILNHKFTPFLIDWMALQQEMW